MGIILIDPRLLDPVSAVLAALDLQPARAFVRGDLIAVRILGRKRAGRVALKRFAAQAAADRFMAARTQPGNRLQRSRAKLIMSIAAGAAPVLQPIVPFVAVHGARALDLRMADAAFLPVLLLVVLQHGLVAELFGWLTLFIAAAAALRALLALLLTGGGVLYKFKVVRFLDLFFAAGADLAVLLVVSLDRLRFPFVRLCLVCNALLALEAEFVAFAPVLRLAVFRLRMLAGTNLAAADADSLLRAVLGDSLVYVRNAQPSVDRGHAEWAGIHGAVASAVGIADTAADVAALGQRIAQHQHVAVLQLARGKARGRIRRTADGIHPAGAAREVKLPNRAVVAAVHIDAGQIEAAPERGFTGIFAEGAVDGGKDRVAVRAVVRPSAAQRLGARSHVGPVAESGKIEAGVEAAVIRCLGGRPAEGFLRRPERVARVIAPDGLRHAVGRGFAGKHLVADRLRHVEADRRHIDIDRRVARRLALAGTFAQKGQRFFAAVAVGVLTGDDERMLVLVACGRILRHERILQTPARCAVAAEHCAVQRHNGIRGGHLRNARSVVLFLAPGRHKQLDARLVFDLLPVLQIRLDLDDSVAAQLVGDVDLKGILLPCVRLRCYGDGVFALAAVLVDQRAELIGFGERCAPAASGLIAGNGADADAAGRVAAGQRQREGQKALCQLIAVDRLRRFILSVRAADRGLRAG